MGRTKRTTKRDIEMTQKTLLQKYEALHDGLSDMIEGGRLTYEMIPDDYDWLLLTLLEAIDMEVKVKQGNPLTISLTRLRDQFA